LTAALSAKGFSNVQPSTQNAPYGAPPDQGELGNFSQGLQPQFASALNQALADAEKATGQKPQINEAYRDSKTQAQYYANYTGKPVTWQGVTYTPLKQGGLAAAPGQSLHQQGLAADIQPGPALDWLHQNAGKYGLSFLPGAAGTADPVHIQWGGGADGSAPTGGASGVNMPSTAGVQPGTLTWASAVNAIKAANPKISPAALALATNQLIPLMNADQAQQWKQIDEQRSQYEAETARISAQRAGIPAGYRSDGQGGLEAIPGGPAAPDVSDVVAKIKSGDMPPPGATGTSRFYPASMNAAIGKEIAKDPNYNLSAHIIDWNAMQRATATQNSPVTTRIVGAIGSARAFLDTFQKNLDTWNAAGLPTIVNQQIMDKASAGLLPGVDQKQAALIKSQYGELVTLLASVFQAGGVPTSSATQLAKEQIDLGWSRGTIDAVIDQINNNLDSREAAIRGVQPFTPGSTGPNTYSQGGGTPAPAQAQPVVPAPAVGTPVPPNGFTDAGASQPPQSWIAAGGTPEQWKYVPPEQRKLFP
jgi:hypothetical protein